MADHVLWEAVREIRKIAAGMELSYLHMLDDRIPEGADHLAELAERLRMVEKQLVEHSNDHFVSRCNDCHYYRLPGGGDDEKE